MRWMLEAECPPTKQPTVPSTDAKSPKSADPTQLARRAAAIIGNRGRLKDQFAKLKTSQAKAAKASPAKKETAEIGVACEKLRVKAKVAKLEQSLNVWKLSVEMAQANLEQHAIELANLSGDAAEKKAGLIKRIKSWLSFGGGVAGDAKAHADNWEDPEFDEPPMPPALKMDYKSWQLKTPDGAEFDVIAHVEKTPAAAPAPVPKPEPVAAPEPEEPEEVEKTLATASAADKAKLVGAVKHAVLAATVASEHAPTVALSVAAEAGFDVSDLDTLQLIADVIKGLQKNIDDLTLDQVSKLATKATDILVKKLGDVGPNALNYPGNKSDMMKALRSASAEIIGDGRLSMAAAKQTLEDAYKNWLVNPKPFDQHTEKDQATIKDAAKTAAVVSAYAEPGESGPNVASIAAGIQSMASAVAGLGVSSDAAFTLAQQAINAYTGLAFDGLTAADQAGVMAAAEKAAKAGKSVSAAVQVTGVHLSSSAMKKVKDAVAPPPDEQGLLDAIENILVEIEATDSIPMTFGGVVTAVEFHDAPFISLMSKYNIEKAKGTPLELKITKLAVDIAKAQWNESKLKKLIFDDWDFQAGAGTAATASSFGSYKMAFVNHAAVWVVNSKEAIKEGGGWEEAIQEFANVANAKNWLTDKLWPEWLKAHEKKGGEALEAKKKATDEFVAAALAAGAITAEAGGLAIPSQDWVDKLDDLAAAHYGGDTNAIIDTLEAAVAANPPDAATAQAVADAAPTGESEPKTVELPADMPDVSSYTKKKKLSKPGDLTSSQKDVLSFLSSEAAYAGLLWTKAGKPKKNLGGVAAGVVAQFKAAHKAAGLDLTINKKMVTDLLADKQVEGKPGPKPLPAAASALPPPSPGSTVALFGMNEAELAQFAAGAPMPGTKMAPSAPGGPGWTSSSADLADSGGSAGSTKLFLSATMDGKQHTAGGKAPASFLAKLDGYRSLGECAANRTQALLGLGGVGADGYLTKHNSGSAFMQWFPNTPNGRDRYGLGSTVAPWMGMVGSGKNNPPENERRRLARGLQLAAVGNWIIGDKDDHGGNFTVDEYGNPQGIDHGQSGKFFNSDATILSHWDWKPTSEYIANKDSNATIEANKGWPKKMLKDWASGADLASGKLPIPIMPLSDLAFEGMIQRAEGIPDDAYEAAWRPYAEGAVVRGKKLAKYSKNPADHTVEGFLAGMQKRRKTIRSQVADLYSMFAAKRAQALAANGDTRPLATIEAEVREQLGIDDFAAGKAKPSAATIAAASPSSEDIGAHVDAPGWDESKLPESSHLPTAAAIAKAGRKGTDWQVPVGDIKDGRVSFLQLGGVPLAYFHLDNAARARLQARLPGYSGSGPPPPTKPIAPSDPPHDPPAKPGFDANSPEGLASLALAGALHGDDSTNYTGIMEPGVTGPRLTKVEKYINKWRDDKLTPPKGSKYFVKALASARTLKASADPLEAAAGAHYEAQLLKFGVEGGEHGFDFKSVEDVAPDERKIKPFVVPAGMAALQQAAKADADAAHAQAIETYQAAWDAQKATALAAHQTTLDKWKEDMAEWQSSKAGADILTGAAKTPCATMPVGVKHTSTAAAGTMSGKANDNSSTWDGGWGPSWDGDCGGKGTNPREGYEIDMTDVISQLGMTATGAKDGRFMVHYVPGNTAKTAGKPTQATHGRSMPGRAGRTVIQFPKGSSKSQMRAMLQRASTVLGIDLRPAAEQEQELTYVRRMAWLLKLEGYSGPASQAEPEGSTQKKIAYWIKKLKKRVGYDPRHAPELSPTTGEPIKGTVKKGPDGEPLPNPYYQPGARDIGARHSFRRFDFTDEALAVVASAATMTHNDSTGSLTKLNEGMLASTEWRTLTGIMAYKNSKVIGGGQSSDRDVQSGGSKEVYFYTGGSKSGARLYLNPRILLETATYSVGSDEYGSKVHWSSESPDKRQQSLQEWRLVEIAGGYASGETTIGDRVDLFQWMESYKVHKKGASAAEVKILRDALREKLKAAGVTHVGGMHGVPKQTIASVVK